MKDSNELFELCKQVYEATGWYGSGSAWIDGTPIYSSDYLLEKLPKSYKTSLFKLYRSVQNTWWAGYAPLLEIKDGTPLKALLKLTLKLHEEKQL